MTSKKRSGVAAVLCGVLMFGAGAAWAGPEVISLQKDEGSADLSAWNGVSGHKPDTAQNNAMKVGSEEKASDAPAETLAKLADCTNIVATANASPGKPVPPQTLSPATAKAVVVAKCHFVLKDAKDKHDYKISLKPKFTANMPDADKKASGKIEIALKLSGAQSVDMSGTYDIAPDDKAPTEKYAVTGTQTGKHKHDKPFDTKPIVSKETLKIGTYNVELKATVSASSGENPAVVKLDSVEVTWR
jgi:hypothetical protein